MADSYAEVIVHDEKDTKGTQLKICLIILTIAMLCFGAMYSFDAGDYYDPGNRCYD